MSRHALDFLMNPASENRPTAATYISASRSSAAAASAPVSWDNRRADTRIPYEHLLLTNDQLVAIADIYKTSPDMDHGDRNAQVSVTRETFASDVAGQRKAVEFLKKHGLDVEARKQLESKWSTTWSTSWSVAGGSDRAHRVLFQCVCGYNTDARRKMYERHQKAKGRNSRQADLPWERRAPYDYHGCLAHADITYIEGTGEVRRVMGILRHNNPCMEALLTRLPPIPLHPHVAEVAIAQLAEGANITAVQIKNIEMLSKCAYREQHLFNPLTSNCRYELLPTDFSSLYRRHNRENGINIEFAPEYNLDNWLDPKHRDYKPKLHESIFFYAARATRDDRLKVCISTKEMDEAAWKYGHENQIILDGTFGVCSTRLLLFIVMGVDEKGRGVPLAMLLFSAPAGTRATHAGYNTDILEELIRVWKDHLGQRNGKSFCPWIAITDTDTKERGALIRIWPFIILLLCRFHLRQCWTNKRKKLFCKRNSDNQDSTQGFWKEHIIRRLHALEKNILLTNQDDDAVNLVATERSFLADLALTTPDTKRYGSIAISYLDYLTSTWLDKSLWSSWSQYGRDQAAAKLKRPVEGVLPTTNHLESFNAVLKRKYIPTWQRSGNRLRFDVFIHHLVLKILPEIFAQRRMQSQFNNWVNERFKTAAGGANLRQELGARSTANSGACQSNGTRLAWFPSDAERELKAKQIVAAGRISQIPEARPYEIWATCAATDADTRNQSHPRYWLTLHPTGSATCTCHDWLRNGGACKHLRALRILVLKGHSSPLQVLHFPAGTNTYHFPASRSDAEIISERNKAWYGPHYEISVTPYENASSMAKLSGIATSDPPKTLTTNILRSGHPPPLAPPSAKGQPISASTLRDQSIFQRVAGDPFQLNNQDDLEGSEFDGAESDSDIESDHAAGNSSAPKDSSASTGSSNLSSNMRAISIQVNKRLQHDLTRVLPVLHGISSILETSAAIDIGEPIVDEFQRVLHRLADQLTKVELVEVSSVLSEATPVDLNGSPSTPMLQPAAVVTARSTRIPSASSTRKHILPPSPEAKQKRKKSHGTL